MNEDLKLVLFWIVFELLFFVGCIVGETPGFIIIILTVLLALTYLRYDDTCDRLAKLRKKQSKGMHEYEKVRDKL